MCRMKRRRINRLLQVKAKMEVQEKYRRRPLVLLIATWRAETHVGLTIPQAILLRGDEVIR